MGQCGCADFAPGWKLPGPSDTVYAIQIYDSCDYCDTPAGVIIEALDRDGQEMWGVDALPELDLSHGIALPVVHPRVLAEKMAEWAGADTGEGSVWSEYDNAAHMMDDGIRETFREAVDASQRGDAT